MLYSTDIEVRMLLISTYLFMKMTEKKSILVMQNSISIMIGIKTEITKMVTMVDEFWFAKSIQITLFCN